MPISDGRKLFHHLSTKPNPTTPHNKTPQRGDFPGNPLLVAAGGYRGCRALTTALFGIPYKKYFSQHPFPYWQVHPALKIQRYIPIAFWEAGRAHLFKLPFKNCWIWLTSPECRMPKKHHNFIPSSASSQLPTTEVFLVAAVVFLVPCKQVPGDFVDGVKSTLPPRFNMLFSCRGSREGSSTQHTLTYFG